MNEGEAVAAAYDRGSARWPDITLDPADFAAHLAMHMPPDVDRTAHIASLAEDLFLACACALSIPRALNIFDQEYMPRVAVYVSHIDPTPSFADEMRQLLRERLLAPRPGGRPRIAEYSGRGALAAWLRIAAVRVALNHRARPDEARRTDDEAVLDQLSTEAAPELQVLRARHLPALEGALRQAVAQLGAEQRVILRMYFASGHSTERIATALRVNRSTAARRLVAAREAVFAETRRLLQEQLPLLTEEFASFARALHDQLNISLSQLLADPVA
jgi:RNA polymerase sigma-70 factor